MFTAANYLDISMSFNKSGFSSMVYKHLRKPVLIAGVLIGGSSVFAGAAKANLHVFECNFTNVSSDQRCTNPSNWTYAGSPPPQTSPPLQLGDKLLNVISYSFSDYSTGAPTPTTPSGHFDFSWLDPNNDGIPNYADDAWNVRTVFDNTVTGDGSNIATGTLNYTLQITDPGWTFTNVELDSGHIGSGVSVNKYINDPAFPMANPASPAGIPYLISTDGSTSNKPLGGTFVNVTDTYTVTAGGGLGAFNNGFKQTPAPLPILGVGAAFGSIRKLRKFSSQLKTFSMG